MTNPHMQRAVQAGAAAIDYWLCENDKAIELSSEIRDMFREGLEAALPHIREMIAKEIRAEEITKEHAPNPDFREGVMLGLEFAAQIAKGPQQ